MAIPDAYRAIELGEFNIGAAAAVAFLNPLTAQIDALLAGGLGPFQSQLAARLNAALGAQAQLTINISLGDFSIIAALKAAIAALTRISASLATGIPTPAFNATSQLSTTAALAASLKAQIGGIQSIVRLALAAKIPAVNAAAGLSAALSAGPVFAISFSDIPLAAAAPWLLAQMAAGGLSADGEALTPAQQVFGVMVFCGVPTLKDGFDAIIRVPT